MIRVLSIGSDRKIFEERSAVQARMIEYAELFEELHLVVFATRKLKILNPKSETNSKYRIQISKNCWVYPTHSLNRWFYVYDAIRIGKKVVENCKLKIENCRNDFVVSAQDPFECGLVAYRITSFFKLPFHVQIHTDFLSPFFYKLSFLNSLRVHLALRLLPKANAIRVVSRRIRDSLSKVSQLRRFGRSPNLGASGMSNVSVLPIFTDIEKFQKTPPTFDLKAKYPKWNFIILLVSRFSEEKNIIFALRLMRKIVKKYPKTGMVIVGSGPLMIDLKSKRTAFGLKDSVAFLPWQSDLVSFYKTANLFLQTSIYEGFGLSLLEAVASGCPAVSSDVGIASELLDYDGRSLICPVNDVRCFVSTITQIIEKNRLRTFFSSQIAPDVVNKFIQNKTEYLRAYKKSIESARTSFTKSIFRVE